jgi:hypothetical protein
MYSNGAICLIKLLFKMGLFTVYQGHYTVYSDLETYFNSGHRRPKCSHLNCSSLAPTHLVECPIPHILYVMGDIEIAYWHS